MTSLDIPKARAHFLPSMSTSYTSHRPVRAHPHTPLYDEQASAQRRLMEIEAGQRAAERTYERNLAAVQEEAKKRVRTCASKYIVTQVSDCNATAERSARAELPHFRNTLYPRCSERGSYLAESRGKCVSSTLLLSSFCKWQNVE